MDILNFSYGLLIITKLIDIAFYGATFRIHRHKERKDIMSIGKISSIDKYFTYQHRQKKNFLLCRNQKLLGK